MKLHVAPRTPNPRRVTMFIAEKGIEGIALVPVDLLAGDTHRSSFLEMNPFGRVPVLELDDGRTLSETRAICSWLEGYAPEPNLMGEGYEERAFIEMADRRVEFYLFGGIANVVRHTHPGLAPLEQPQFPEYGQAQVQKVREVAAWFDHVLERQPWIAGERFTIADITAFCAIEFARLMKFQPGREGMPALQAWRDRVAERPSALVK